MRVAFVNLLPRDSESTRVQRERDVHAEGARLNVTMLGGRVHRATT
jgi:hypothetical protein